MTSRRTRTLGVANRLDQLGDVSRRWRRELADHIRNHEVHNRTDGTNRVGLNAEPAVLAADQIHKLGAFNEHDAGVGKHVEQSRTQACNHTGDGTSAVHTLGEDTHQDRGEQ